MLYFDLCINKLLYKSQAPIPCCMLAYKWIALPLILAFIIVTVTSMLSIFIPENVTGQTP